MKLLRVRCTGKQGVPVFRGVVLFFYFYFTFFSPPVSFKEVVAVHLKRAILLPDLELKIPCGAGDKLCTPRADGSFACVLRTRLEREVI